MAKDIWPIQTYGMVEGEDNAFIVKDASGNALLTVDSLGNVTAAGDVVAGGSVSENGDITIATGKTLTIEDLTPDTVPKVGTAGVIEDGTITDDGTSVGIPTAKTLDVVDADALTVGGVIVPQVLEIMVHIQAAAAMLDQSFFLANRAYQVTAVKEVHAVAESSATNLHIQVTKDSGTDAPGAGDALLTNNTNDGFDGKATANTVQAGTLTATTAFLQMAAGDRLSVTFEDTATELEGMTISVTLMAI